MLNNQKYGLLIKLNRNDQNYSVRSLARRAGVDYSYLAKIEKGQIICHETVIASILRELQINEDEIKKYDQKIKESFDYIFLCIVYQVNDADPIVKELISIEHLLRKSLRYIDFVLIYYVYQIANGLIHLRQHEIEKFLNENINFMSSNQQALFYDYLGLRFYCDTDIRNAKKYLEKSRLMNNDLILQAMISYHKGMVYASNGDLIEALEYYRKGKVLFDEDANMVRSFYCQMAIANAYSLLGKNKKSILIYEHLVVIANQLVLGDSDRALLFSNLSWFYLLSSDYITAIHYNEMAVNFRSDIINHFYFVWLYYKSNNINDCLHWIEKSKFLINKQENTCVELNFILVVEKWIHQLFIEQDILDLLKQAKEDNSKKMIQFIIKILIEFYESNHELEKLNSISKEYIELINI